MAVIVLVGSAEDSLSQWALPALRALDALLEAAATTMQHCTPKVSSADISLPGLCIQPAEVERLLARPPCAPFWCNQKELPSTGNLGDATPLLRLQQVFGLSTFDLWLLLIALAPEADLSYERIYGFLQDDITRRRPTIELALNLLCGSTEEKLSRQAHFTPNAPLIRHHLLRVQPDPNHAHPPLLSFDLILDEGILRLLLQGEDLDARLGTFCRLYDPTFDFDALLLTHDKKQALAKLALPKDGANRPLRLYFWGPRGAGKRSAAEGLAKLLRARLMVADFERCTLPEPELQQIPGLLCRDACLNTAVLFVRGADTLQNSDRKLHYYRLVDEFKRHRGVVILAGELPWTPRGPDELQPYTISFAIPDFSARQTAWQNALDLADIDFADDATSALASRFRLTPGQIAEATREAVSTVQARFASASAPLDDQKDKPGLGDLFLAARNRYGDELGKLARRVQPNYSWKDIVLPLDQLAHLQEICSQAKLRHVVYGDWGFDRKLSLGKGLNILFAGPPGTGKTMAAEVIAKELELYLYKIDLSQMISKYIGETEKNLDRIFTAAENSNAILFFDEADALFGKRSEVKDSHDRYANIEIGYLLQKMEEYEGIAILATNLRQNLDEAFVRRIQNIVEFPFPAVEQRQRIWEVTFPEQTPLAEDVDFRRLAQAVKLAGGNIKNIAIIAAFYAAADGGVIGMPHLIRACSREYQKLGQTWSGAELGSPAALSAKAMEITA